MSDEAISIADKAIEMLKEANKEATQLRNEKHDLIMDNMKLKDKLREFDRENEELKDALIKLNKEKIELIQKLEVETETIFD